MAEFLKGLKRNSLKIPELSEFFVSDFGDTSYKVALPRIEFNKTNEVKFWLTIYFYFDVSMIMVIITKKNKYLKKSIF